MSGRLAEGVQVVGRMVALRDDGTPVPILWLAWPEEDEDEATAYELLPDGRLVECGLGKLSNWQRLAALTGPEGGG